MNNLPQNIIRPTGYQILVKMVKAPRQIGLIAVPEERATREDLACPMGEVLAIGPDCWTNTEVYPPRPRGTRSCKVGDIVMFRSYTGVRVQIMEPDENNEYRLINDDVVVANITDPSLIRRGE